MRWHAWIAIACCVVLACSKPEEKHASRPAPPSASICDSVPLADLIRQHPIHVILGAADVVEGTPAISDSTYADWLTFEPEHLVERIPAGDVAAAIRRLCATLDALAPPVRSRAVNGIASWVSASLAIDRAQYASPSIEFFANAVVHVPEVRAAIPEDVIARIPDERAGDTMASGEFTEMNYRLTHMLSRMSESERDRILDEISTKATDLLRREAP
jgi:hypothetical protein